MDLRPRILIAVQAQYGGHLARALVYLEILKTEYDISMATVGAQPADWFRDALAAHQVELLEFPGPGMVEDSRGGISFGGTLLKYMRDLPRFAASTGAIAETLFRLKPIAVISDFEPHVADLCTRFRIPLLTIDAHRRFYLRACPRPALNSPAVWRDYLGMRTALTLMHRRGDLNIALSLFPLRSSSREAICILPPLLRSTALKLTPTAGDHLLVYHNSGGEREDILAQCQGIPTRVYGYGNDSDETIGTVQFRRASSEGFLQDLASCRAYASRAGFESVAEAMLLGKPCQLVPQNRQYEQRMNALHAARLGAVVSKRFDYRAAYNNRQRTLLDRGWLSSAHERFRELVRELPERA